MPLLFTAFLLLTTLQNISAQQQSSTFSIPGWTPGTAPVFSGSHSNVVSLAYGDSLTTLIAFAGTPDDGLGTDQDNMASMSFSYSYTVYLTPAGGLFSASTSLPIGTHTVSAYQSCTSGIVPPWTISYDAQPAVDTNSINMNVADEVKGCIPQGNYQVDIVFNTYAQNSIGPNVQQIQLQWLGYANSSSTATLTELTPPSTTNTDQVAIGPSTSYLLSQIAFVQVNAPASCPTPVLTLPASIQTSASICSATVTASYPGYCQQDPCTYLWSDGETTATAVNLAYGSYTVTVTTPCGTIATASINISGRSWPLNMTAELLATDPGLAERDIYYSNNNTATTGRRSHENTSEAAPKAHLNTYPNPAMHNISFDLGNGSTIHSVRILDIVGNEVMTVNIANDQKADLNIDALQAGVYLYEVESDQTYRGKFVKQ